MKRTKATGKAQVIVTLPPDLVAKLERMFESPNGRGWLRLLDLLRDAASDPVVAASPGASGFLAVVTVLAEDGLADVNGGDTFLPLDGAMPLGEIGARRSKQVAGFAAKGNTARVKYSQADKHRWAKLVRDDADLRRLHKSSARECARTIAEREGLPPAAVETIRKAI